MSIPSRRRSLAARCALHVVLPVVVGAAVYVLFRSPRLRLCAYGSLNVRAGPGGRFRVLRQLRRGDTLSLAEPDARGWARIMGADSGHVFTRLNLVRTERPAVIPDYRGRAARPCARCTCG